MLGHQSLATRRCLWDLPGSRWIRNGGTTPSDRIIRRRSPADEVSAVCSGSLVEVLRGGNAHMPFAEAVAEFPETHINTKPPRVAYRFWYLLEHLRVTQGDILDYLTNSDYHAPAWPQDYWPPSETRATTQAWDESVAAFQRDLGAMISIAADDGTDLFGSVPSNAEHTVLREVLIVADHNAYHIGELETLRQVTEAWSMRHSAE